MIEFKDTPYGKKLDPNFIIWVDELMAGTNPMERLEIANQKVGWQHTDLSDDPVREAIYQYLVHKNSNKAQLLFSKQIMFYNCNKQALISFEADKADDMAKLNKLASDLAEQIEKLVIEVYGDFKEIGQEQMKVALTPEMRLKNKK